MTVRMAVAAIAVGWWMGGAAWAQVGAASTNGGILQPAVMSLQQTMDALRVEKWKAPRDVKAMTVDNLGSIRRDLEGTLPGLVTAADAAPGSLAALLALSRNVGALYDVVLRVTVTAESAAPGEQADALAASLSGLESARRTLADRQQQVAAADEAKIADLQKQLSARAAVAAVCPPVVAVPKAAPASGGKRKKRPVRPAAKVAAPAAKAAGSGS